MAEHPLILQINRPQYVMAPEAFITALAQKVFDRHLPQRGTKALGYMYKADKLGSSTLEIRQTFPEQDQLDRFADALDLIDADKEKDRSLVAHALAISVLGTAPVKSTGRPASPVTPYLALSQDLRGFQRTKNPPDLGAMLTQLFTLGLPPGTSCPHPATLWLEASEYRISRDPLLNALDRGVRRGILPFEVSNASSLEPVVGVWDLSDSPLRWLSESWQAITSQKWLDALPTRIWVDWATTVLRLGFGMGFLWEATWYESLGRTIVDRVGATVRSKDVLMPDLLPWKASDSTTSNRDVASLLKWRVARGDAVRKVLLAHSGEDAARLSMQVSPSLAKEIQHALSSPGSQANLWEAIRYALKTRDAAGRQADHYGLLTQKGRFLMVDPGTEWMTVVASLTAGPGGITDVGSVMASLFGLGLTPELRDVSILLEQAGLSRGSADADYGIEVRSAF